MNRLVLDLNISETQQAYFLELGLDLVSVAESQAVKYFSNHIYKSSEFVYEKEKVRATIFTMSPKEFSDIMECIENLKGKANINKSDIEELEKLLTPEY